MSPIVRNYPLTMLFKRSPATPPDIESVRKDARILVIDDHVFPFEKLFQRDGYHIERWASIKNLSQLTDGHYDLILLDVQGIGLKESPDLQGLGVLEHVKRANPAQAVILYSSQTFQVSMSSRLILADAVLDKGVSYVDYKQQVDELLIHHATPGYFIAAMNAQLGANAALVPKATGRALAALRNGQTAGLRHYLENRVPDRTQVDRIIHLVSVGAQVIAGVKA